MHDQNHNFYLRTFKCKKYKKAVFEIPEKLTEDKIKRTVKISVNGKTWTSRAVIGYKLRLANPASGGTGFKLAP